MQTRPYPEKDGSRIWLDRDERKALLETVEGEPRRRIALQLALHGLRTDELVETAPGHVRDLPTTEECHMLVVPKGKTGKRELPISPDLADRIYYVHNADRDMKQADRIVDVSKRTVRNWIADAREALDDAGELGMHDLRRTWATDTYYSLAFAGVPIAEQLTMSWGGWKQSESGRSTFRENYLGPVPDHITERAVGNLALI